jgi:hypothetical protein
MEQEIKAGTVEAESQCEAIKISNRLRGANGNN